MIEWVAALVGSNASLEIHLKTSILLGVVSPGSNCEDVLIIKCL